MKITALRGSRDFEGYLCLGKKLQTTSKEASWLQRTPHTSLDLAVTIRQPDNE
jgi:hypothetical protein